MDQVPNLPGTPHRPVFSAIMWIVGVVFLLLACAYLYITFSGHILQPLSQNVPTEPSGMIYLSLVKNTGTPQPIGVYTFGFGDKILTPYLPANDSKKEQYTNISLSNDGKQAVVLALSYNKPGDRTVYLLDPADPLGAKTALVSINSNDPVSIMHPAWSPGGNSIAYMTNKFSDQQHFFDANSWDLFTADTNSGQVQTAGNGLFPTFVSNSQFIALKSDGIYIFDVPKAETQAAPKKIWELASGVAEANMQFDVSQDKKMIAWTVPHLNKVMIMDVTSWTPFSGTVRMEIPVRGFWPKFSPDGNFLALEQVDNNDVNQQLVVFYLSDSNFKKDVLYSLTDYVQTALFITDWK